MHFTLYTADCRENARNIRYPNPAAITTAADLKKATAYDHVCAQYADGIRKEANFQFSDVLPMDCDNDHSDNPNDWLTPERLAQLLPDVAFAATYSRHHMQAKGKYSARPRFHVFFPTAACTNAATHKAMKLRIQKALPFFDGNALDAARFLFGASGEVFWQEGSLHIENWLLLQTARRNIPQGQRNSTMSRLAGKLVKRYGVTEEAHTKFLEQSAACNPPLSDTELQQIWKSAERFGRRLAEQPDYIAPAAFSTQPQPLPALLPEDFPVPARYAHPVVLQRMIRVLREGRAQSVGEALNVMKKDLKALNASVQVEQEEYDEVVAIKPMFLLWDYE